MKEDTPGIEVLWNDHKNFKLDVQKKFEILDDDIADLRSYLKTLDEKLDEKFEASNTRVDSKFDSINNKIDTKLESINSAITNVTLNAINAMPKWAMEASARKDLIINALVMLLAAALTGIVTWAIAK